MGKLNGCSPGAHFCPAALALVAAFTACSRPKAKGFSGYAFIANQEGGAVAAVDLEVFAVARHIRVDGAPTAVVARRQHARVYALTPENGSVHEIRAANLTFSRKLTVAQRAISMRLSRRTRTRCTFFAASRAGWSRWLWIRCAWIGSFALREDPYDFDISSDGTHAGHQPPRGSRDHLRRSRAPRSRSALVAPRAKSVWSASSIPGS